METVKVTTKTLFEDTHHQDPPQLHPRTSHVAIGARQNVLLQQREQLLAGLLVRIQMLETKEYRWNVIAGFMIQLDVLDPCLTECELRFLVSVSIDVRRAKIADNGRIGEEVPV